MTSRILFFSWLALLPSGVYGQDVDSFEFLSIDRPDVSNLPTTVRPGHYQFEIGVEYGTNDFVKEYSLPNFLLRTGLTKNLELRLGVAHLQVDSGENKPSEAYIVNNLSFKYRILDEKGFRPSIALQPDVILGFREQHESKNPSVDFGLVLLFNNSVHEKIFINYNAGVFLLGDLTELLLSASTSFMHTHRLGYFFEIYQISESMSLDNFSFDGGIMFLVKPRLQLDVYVGHQELPSADRLFVGFGVGFRLDKGDLKPKTFREIGIHH